MATLVTPDDDDRTTSDLTPMIDIIFLLLIFFLLTTTFVEEEKVIDNLLPTAKGNSAAPAKVEPQYDINLVIYPANHAPTMDVRTNQELWQTQRNTATAVFQVGQHEPVVIDGERLSQTDADGDELQRIHQMVHTALAEYETVDRSRTDQDPIVIHCFSGLPWKYALAAYDSVRAYEAQFVTGDATAPRDLNEARAVTWAPPLVRHVNNWAMGNELFEIMHRATR